MYSTNIRPPHITGQTEQERLEQIERYLFTLAQELQIAFESIQNDSLPMTAAQKHETKITKGGS